MVGPFGTSNAFMYGGPCASAWPAIRLCWPSRHHGAPHAAAPLAVGVGSTQGHLWGVPTAVVPPGLACVAPTAPATSPTGGGAAALLTTKRRRSSQRAKPNPRGGNHDPQGCPWGCGLAWGGLVWRHLGSACLILGSPSA